MHQEDLGRFKVVISEKKGGGEKPGEEKFSVQSLNRLPLENSHLSAVPPLYGI